MTTCGNCTELMKDQNSRGEKHGTIQGWLKCNSWKRLRGASGSFSQNLLLLPQQNINPTPRMVHSYSLIDLVGFKRAFLCISKSCLTYIFLHQTREGTLQTWKEKFFPGPSLLLFSVSLQLLSFPVISPFQSLPPLPTLLPINRLSPSCVLKT